MYMYLVVIIEWVSIKTKSYGCSLEAFWQAAVKMPVLIDSNLRFDRENYTEIDYHILCTICSHRHAKFELD